MVGIVLPSLVTEDELLASAQQSDQQAILQIYEVYFPPIYQFIRLRVDDPELAQDLASEVFVRFIASIGTSNTPQHSLRGWLFQVARSLLYHHYQKNEQLSTETLEERLRTSTSSGVEAQFIRSENRDRLLQAIRNLAAEQQEVLILRFGQALSLEDTAAIMDKSVAAIKSLQFRATDNLRRVLSEMKGERRHE